MNTSQRSMGHITVKIGDLEETRSFYERTLGLRHSGTAGIGEDALTVMAREAICFMSCGDAHHDFAGFQPFDKNWNVRPVTPDDFHHISFTLRPEHSLDEFKKRLSNEGVDYASGPALPDPTETYTGENSLHFRDPNGHWIEVHTAEIDSHAS